MSWTFLHYLLFIIIYYIWKSPGLHFLFIVNKRYKLLKIKHAGKSGTYSYEKLDKTHFTPPRASHFQQEVNKGPRSEMPVVPACWGNQPFETVPVLSAWTTLSVLVWLQEAYPSAEKQHWGVGYPLTSRWKCIGLTEERETKLNFSKWSSTCFYLYIYLFLAAPTTCRIDQAHVEPGLAYLRC